MKTKFAKIKNVTKHAELQTLLEVCDDIASRTKGLMFRKNPASLFFDFDYMGIHSIHSCFVNFEFDAIYLDDDWNVVDVFFAIRPFQALISPSSACRYLLELPTGHAHKLSAAKNDRIEVEWSEDAPEFASK